MEQRWPSARDQSEVIVSWDSSGFVSFGMEKDCGEDFGRDCKSVGGKAALAMQERKGRIDEVQRLKGAAFVLRMCGRPCSGGEMDPERRKVCASDTRQQMGGKLVDLVIDCLLAFCQC